MDTINNAAVAEVFNNCPKHMRKKLMFLRRLVLNTAAEIEGVTAVEETLKWGVLATLQKAVVLSE